MNPPRHPARAVGYAAVLAGAAVLAVGCSSSTAAPASSGGAKTAESRPACRGTLGFEAVPLTKAVRARLKLPADAAGVAVVSVLPGGPAEAAGLRTDDVVGKIGADAIQNDCDWSRAAFGRACEPVTLAVVRGEQRLELTVAAVDENRLLGDACHGGNSTACFRTGWLLWSRDRGDGHALEIFEDACKSGSADACAYAGLQLSLSSERGSEAPALLERSCELGSGAGCAHLGFLYATSASAAASPVPKDDRRAAQLYAKSCALGDAQGCYNAGLMADEGRGLRQDASKAAAAYDEACELGSSMACTNLGFLYEHGKGVKADRPRAFALYRRGCEGSTCQPSNLGGCVNVGRAYRDGIGVDKDEAKAAGVFQDACDRKTDDRDVHSAENRARACSLLGALYLAGDGIPKNLERGREMTELGCDRGDSFGCFNAATIYANGTGVAADAAQAADFFEKACDLGDGEACSDLGAAYEKGAGVKRDKKRAAELRKKACELGFTAACPKKK